MEEKTLCLAARLARRSPFNSSQTAMNRMLTLLAVLLSSTITLAQDEQPEAQPAKATRKPAAQKPVITDPAVLAVLELKPQTPPQQFEAARLLADLNQPELAREFLKQLMQAKLDDAALAALADKFDTPTFLRFGRTEALAPEAAQFVSAVLAAAEKVGRDPARLERLAQQLSDPGKISREDAIVALHRAGSAAVGPLLSGLADGKRASEHAALREMILLLNNDATAPLSSGLEAPDAGTRVLAIELLGQLNAKTEIPALVAAHADTRSEERVKQAAASALAAILGNLPTAGESQRFLERAAQKELELARRIDSLDNYGEPPTREIWRWDAKSNRPTMSIEPAANVARRTAARLARTLTVGGATEPARQRLFVGTVLEEAKHRHGIDRPLAPEVVKEVAPLGAETVSDVLRQAISSGGVAAAIGAAEVLGEIGSPALLEGVGGRRSPLAEAAWHPDRRVRFAAIEAILKLKPVSSFAGASAVGDGLKFLACTSGQRKALVADPRSAAGQQLASYLSQLGYQVEMATNGRDAFAVATSSPDFELAFVHAALDHPRADDLLAQFRKDPRTAMLPVALIAVADAPESAERLARGVPRCRAFAEPQDAEGLKHQVERLLGMPDCQTVPLDIRQFHAARAVAALVQHAEQPVPWLDARAISRSLERSLDYPAMPRPVASLLASTGTATGQSELVRLAARESLPLAMRALAATAFARSAAKFGVLLPSDQILAQYDHYNSNAGRNRDTHKVMLIILEAIEPKSEEESQKSNE